MILQFCSIPQVFKTTCITPIYKRKGKRTCPSSYRPISCLNLYCKLFERVLYQRLRTRIESKLCNNQHGFRTNRSCDTALIEFTNYIYDALDKPNGKVIAIYFDARSAFNSLDRSLLINKLMEQYQLHPRYVKTIYNYMTNTLFKFKGSDEYFVNSTGIIQGGPVMPLLYSAYQDDIAKIIYLSFILYADDLCVYLAGDNLDDMICKLLAQIDSIIKWYDDNNMKINFDKTKYQIFHKCKDPLPPKYCNLPLILNGGQEIEQVTCFKYLGVHIDSVLGFNVHYQSVLNRVSSNLGCIFSVKRYLTDKLLSIFISCYIHSIIDYGINIWGVKTNLQFDAIQKRYTLS